MRTRIPALAVGLAGLLSACADNQPAANNPGSPKPRSTQIVQAVACVASVRSNSVTCQFDSSSASQASLQKHVRNAWIVGGQGQYVQLTSSNVAYDGSSAFAFDVSIQSLIPQIMGTTDGATPDGSGVRIFFSTEPTATSLTDPSGSSSITIDNADGMGTFTAAGQPYFQYDGSLLGGDAVLEPNETSGTKPWRFLVDPNVQTFSFFLYVSTNVQYPQGFVEVAEADTILSGDTVTLTGTVRTAAGIVLPDTIFWSTSDTTVITVDSLSGLVTAVGAGRATVIASAGLRIGITQLSVCHNLAIGGTFMVSGADAEEVCLGGSDVREYTAMPVNTSTSSNLSLTTVGTGIQAVTGPPAPNLLPGGAGFRRSVNVPGGDGLDELAPPADDPTVAMRAAERREIANVLASRSGIRRSMQVPNVRRTVTPGVPTVGDYMNLNVAQGCSGTTDLRTGQVRTVSTHTIILSDTANPPGGFTTAQYDSIAAEFDTIAYAVIPPSFGAPSDLDNNSRIVLFFTRAVNELSPPASSVVTNSYFATRDLFSVSSCERSNEGEVLYLLVPDPTGVVNSNVRTVSFVRGSAIRSAGHELQHLINASRRMHVHSSSTFEEAWLDEGMSLIAEELMFYKTSVGLVPRGNIQLTSLTTGPNASRRVAAFNTYANSNYGKFRSWLQRPDTTGLYGSGGAARLAQSGFMWAFLRYTADRVGGTEDNFWAALTSSAAVGVPNLEAAISGASVNTWLSDFVASMYADDAVAGANAVHTNPSWNYRSVYGGLGGFPLGTQPLNNGVGLTLSYARGGATYIRFGAAAGTFAFLRATSGGVAPPSQLQLMVMRTK